MLKEFVYIKWIQKQLKYPSEIFIRSGDDAAGIRIGRNSVLVTTDFIVEGIDFHLKTATPYQIGYKALAVSISDMAAMGGVSEKLYAVATVALRPNLFLRTVSPQDESAGKFAQELFRGMKSVADKFKVSIVGGDVSSVKGPISISTTILGVEARHAVPIQRSGAQIGDAIMVTGELGGSILGKHLNFIPRLNEARILTKMYTINSMIDISDGLLADLNHILEASDKGAVLFESLIPVSSAARKLSQKDKKSPLHHSLFDGEDFELLFTLPMREAERLLRDKPFKTMLSLIGIIQFEKGILLLDKNGRTKKIKPKGYEHIL